MPQPKPENCVLVALYSFTNRSSGDEKQHCHTSVIVWTFLYVRFRYRRRRPKKKYKSLSHFGGYPTWRIINDIYTSSSDRLKEARLQQAMLLKKCMLFPLLLAAYCLFLLFQFLVLSTGDVRWYCFHFFSFSLWYILIYIL